MGLVLRLGLVTMLVAAPSIASAEWRRTSDVELNTAYTVEEGALSVGLFAPLVVGVTDDFQAAIHPLLLLLGQPSLALRLRVTDVGDATVAVNLAGAWSFIQRETKDGDTDPTTDERRGFPGSLQLTTTTTFRLGRSALLSVGGGLSADFLGEVPVRGLVELHASGHLLLGNRHLLMVQLIGSLPFTGEPVSLVRPTAQLLYAWSAGSRVHLALGVGIGDFAWETSSGTTTSLAVFPLLDVWFRF